MKRQVPTKSEKAGRNPRSAKRSSAKAKPAEERKSERSKSAKGPKPTLRSSIKSKKASRNPRSAKRSSGKAKVVEERKSERSESGKEPKTRLRVPIKSKKAGRGTQLPRRPSANAKLAEEKKSEIFQGSSGQPTKFLELPELSEHAKVVLLPVNPYLVHVYWEAAPNELEELERILGRPDPRARPVLRFYDITNIVFDGSNAHSCFDVEIDLRAGNWYVHLWSPEKSYCADLGIRTEGGQFYRLARSNIGEAPRAEPSVKVEDRYMLVQGDYRRVESVPPPVEHLAGPPKPPAALRGTAQQQVTDKEPALTGRRMVWVADSSEIAQLLAAPYNLGGREEPVPEPRTWLAGSPQPKAKDYTDITEMNEESFRFGISSGKTASTKGKTAVSEHPKLKADR